MKENEFDGEIAIKNTNNEYEVMKRFDINKANEGLGYTLYLMDEWICNSKIRLRKSRLGQTAFTKAH